MKAIILAAGYATRLYPLTENMPKALLKVGNKSILDHILGNLIQIEAVDEIHIVSNEKFYKNFVDWKEESNYKLPVIIHNDGTTGNDNRLGALGDLKFVLDQANISDDIIVLAGDNLMGFALRNFYDFYKTVDSCALCAREVEPHEATSLGIIQLDQVGRIIDFEEKPEKPKSNKAAFAIYIYKKETLGLLDEYLAAGNNPDAPGNFPAWLFKREPVYAYLFDGSCYDIGTHDAYNEVQELYKDK